MHELEAGQRGPVQLDLFQNLDFDAAGLEVTEPMETPPSEIELELENLDLNSVTPLEALQILVSWQKKLQVKGGSDQ